MIFAFLSLTYFISLSMLISKSIHVVANGIIPFFFTAKSYSEVYTYRIFFAHSSVNGRFDCSHALAVGNSAAMRIGVCVCFEHRCLFST